MVRDMISVIIPTFNEADIIEMSLRHLIGHQGSFEVIVADGGSTDGTLEKLALFPEVRRVRSPLGRGLQMNLGAQAARGDIFLFLHADTTLPPDAFRLIEEALSDDSVAAGSFTLSFDRSSPLLKLYSLFSRINHILFTYGDQGLFVPAPIFRAVGGFQKLLFMEDVEIQKRLRGWGRFVKVQSPVVTSARRFIRNGIVRQQLVNTILVSLYHLGVSPAILKRTYR